MSRTKQAPHKTLQSLLQYFELKLKSVSGRVTKTTTEPPFWLCKAQDLIKTSIEVRKQLKDEYNPLLKMDHKSLL